jgi:aminopeptidase YwaD
MNHETRGKADTDNRGGTRYRIADSFADETLSLVSEIMAFCPDRETGKPGAAAAAEAIKAYYESCCDEARTEDFHVHPGQIWNIGRILALLYLLSFAAALIGGPGEAVSVFLLTTGAVYGFVHFIFYGRWFDGLFARERARNVVGVVEPAGRTERQVIVVGHYDSQYVVRFLDKRQALYGARMGAAIFSYLAALALVLAAAISGSFALWPTGRCIVAAALAIGGFFVLPLFWFFKSEVSPGAGDNLLSAVLTAKIGEAFGGGKSSSHPRLGSTRLVLLATDAEEVGQRGAQAYIEAHKAEMRQLPTYVFNLDSLYRYEDLTVLMRDRNGLTKMPEEMITLCLETADSLGYAVKTAPIPFGGGGTDASWFAANGIPTVSIIGMPFDFRSREVYYHTTRDTVDKIDPQIIRAAAEIVINAILLIDRGSGKKPERESRAAPLFR